VDCCNNGSPRDPVDHLFAHTNTSAYDMTAYYYC